MKYGDRRLGIVYISKYCLERIADLTVFCAQLKFLSLRVEYSAVFERFEIQAACEQFDIVPDGEPLPEYAIVYKDGRYMFEKVEV